MSLDRNDSDERPFDGVDSPRGPGASDSEQRIGSERGDRRGEGGPLDRRYGYDDPYRARRSRRFEDGGGYDGRDYYGRDDQGARADSSYEERVNPGYADIGPDRRRHADERDAARAWYEEARDYVRGQSVGRARRASRSHVRCRDIMTRDVTVATPETSLNEVAAMMRDDDTGVIPVVERQQAEATEAPDGNTRGNAASRDNGRLVGLVTDRDIVVRALAEGKDPQTTRVEEVMTTDIHTAQPNDRVIDTIRKMGDKQVRRIPVVDDKNNLRGIISMADVALETEEDRELADALEEISSGASFWSKVS